MWKSVPHRPTAVTRTSTSRGPGSSHGTSRSSIRPTSTRTAALTGGRWRLGEVVEVGGGSEGHNLHNLQTLQHLHEVQFPEQALTRSCWVVRWGAVRRGPSRSRS